MVMGDTCTRSCGFCSVSTGRPEILDLDEPKRVAQAAKTLGLEHVVVTSVNRDDLPDEGASHFVEVIRELRSSLGEDIIIEILTPDFKRTQAEAVRLILEASPDIFNHNVETIPSLYRRVRPQADYQKSLDIFRVIHQFGSDPSTRGSVEPLAQDSSSKTARVLTKSGLMLGLGESREEVLAVLKDLREAGCDILTLGQYLQSSTLGLPVTEYIHPDIFSELKNTALGMGFGWVESGPFVRSSFHAKDSFIALKEKLHAGS